MKSSILLIFGFLTLILASDCSFTAQRLYTKAEVRSCLDLLPFSRSDALETAAQIESVLSGHVFKDYLKYPPTGFEHLRLDLSAEVAVIASRQPPDNTRGAYVEFHDDVAALMRRQRDPHAVWAKPRCLSRFVSTLPFNTTRDGDTIVIERPSAAWLVSEHDSRFNTTFEARFTKGGEAVRLVTINGVSAAQFILDAALEIGYVSKDDQALFNAWLGADFTRRSGLTYNLAPEGKACQDGMTMMFEDGTTETVQYSLYTLGDASYTTLSDFAELCQDHKTAAASAPSSAPSIHGPARRMLRDEFLAANNDNNSVFADESCRLYTEAEVEAAATAFVAAHPPAPARGATPFEFTERDLTYLEYACDTEINVYHADNGTSRVLIAHIASFGPENGEQFAAAMHGLAATGAAAAAAGHAYDKVVLSVVGNGGGIISYGYLLANFLGAAGRGASYAPASARTAGYSPSRLYPLAAPYDTLVSPFMNTEVFAEMQKYLYETSFDFVAPSVRRQRAFSVDHSSTWSAVAALGIDAAGADAGTDRFLSAAARFAQANISPENILVVSDGVCGSTCSTFVNRVAGIEGESHLAQVVVVGGFPGSNKPMLPSSFPGGCVLDSNFVADATKGAMGVMPSNAYLRFPGVALYPFARSIDQVSQVPLEFMDYSHQTDIRIPEIFVRPSSLTGNKAHKSLAGLLAALAPAAAAPAPAWARTGAPCTLPHALAREHNGKCTVVHCDYGYMVREDGSACDSVLFTSAISTTAWIVIGVSIVVIVIGAIVAAVWLLVRRSQHKRQERYSALLLEDRMVDEE